MDVGVFWDYENVRCPNNMDASQAANAIRNAVLALPNVRRIQLNNLYYDARKANEAKTDRVGLSELGIHLIDCPSRGSGQKETVDKKLIVDAMHYGLTALDPVKACVVLITSDGDFAYLLSTLRNSRVHTVVIHGEQPTTAKLLLDACDISMSWRHDVLEPHVVNGGDGGGGPMSIRPPSLPGSATTVAPAPAVAVALSGTVSSGDDFSAGVGSSRLAASSAAPAAAAAPASGSDDVPEHTTAAAGVHDELTDISPPDGAPLPGDNQEAFELAATHLPVIGEDRSSLSDDTEGRHITFLYCLATLLRNRPTFAAVDRVSGASFEDGSQGWLHSKVTDGSVAALFYQRSGGVVDQERYQALRDSAEAGGFAIIWRRDLLRSTPQRVQLQQRRSEWRSSMYGRDLSYEIYLQLTPAGLAQLDSEEGAAGASPFIPALSPAVAAPTPTTPQAQAGRERSLEDDPEAATALAMHATALAAGVGAAPSPALAPAAPALATPAPALSPAPTGEFNEDDEARQWIVPNPQSTATAAEPYWCLACQIPLSFGPDNHQLATMHLGGRKHRDAERSFSP